MHDAVYARLSDANLAALTFYKVNAAIPFDVGLSRPPAQLVREYDLADYDPFYQAQAFNEGSCIVHAWKNRLHEGADYVGIVQYDMPIADQHMAYWQGLMARGVPIIADARDGQVTPALLERDYVRDPPFFGFPMAFAMDRLCRHFSVSPQEVKARLARRAAEGQQLALLNSFIVRADIFDELASWITAISKDVYDLSFSRPDHVRHHGHMGGIIERCVGLFFLFRLADGERIAPLGLDHNPIAESHRTLFGQR